MHVDNTTIITLKKKEKKLKEPVNGSVIFTSYCI